MWSFTNVCSRRLGLILLLLVPSFSGMSVTLFSDPLSRTIPESRSCSCQLVVFPYNRTSLLVIVSDFSLEVTDVTIAMKQLNRSFTVAALNNTALLPIDPKGYEPEHYQTTETFSICLFSGQSSVSCEERKVYLLQNVEEYTYVINLPQNAIWVTQLLALVLVILLAHNITYRRFTPLTFGFLFAILYSAFLFLTVYLSITRHELISEIIIYLFAYVFMCVYFQDLVSIFVDKTLIILVASFLLSALVLAIDMLVLVDMWYLNDLIAAFVAGALVKFVVIKKLKAAVLPLGFLWLFFIVRQFGMLMHIQDFEQSVEIKIIPLFLQIPSMLNDSDDGYICSAFGTSKITSIGLLLNYAVRVDLFLSTRFYEICLFSIAALCLTIQLAFSILFDDMPVMEYLSTIIFLPVALAFMLLFAHKRGEWAEVWHGSFHDMAVNRASVRRESLLDLSSVQKAFDELRMNNSVEAPEEG